MESLFAGALLLLSAGSAQLTATEKQPLAVERIGDWEIIADDNACSVAASFGEGDHRIVAAFTRDRPGEDFSLALYSPLFKSLPDRLNVTIDFGPSTNPHDVPAFGGSSGDYGKILLSGRLDDYVGQEIPSITSEQDRLVTYFRFQLSPDQNYLLKMGPMDAPMRMLRTCSENLMRKWGLDPSEQANLQRPATPANNPGNWVTTADYPAVLYARGVAGMIFFRIDVDAQGNIASCHAWPVMGDAIFSDLTCQLIESRARFKPALDRDGKPIASIYINRVRWTPSGR